MAELGGRALLDIWCGVQGMNPWEAGVHLLALGDGSPSTDPLLDLPLGERDRRLFVLREAWFGHDLASQSACPACGERVELNVTTDMFTHPPSPGPPRRTERLSNGREVEVRALTTRDLRAVAGMKDPVAARWSLLRSTVRVVPRPIGDSGGEEELSTGELEEGGLRASALDPRAEILLDVICPRCIVTWQVSFDIAARLVSDLRDAAERLIEQVDRIARVYHWSEQEILDLPGSRRQRYLDLVLG